jgi:hypothetical protein
MRKSILTLFFIFSALFLQAQETIKTMMYNVLDFPSAYPPNRAQLLKSILDEYEPDIFMVCELQSEYGANLILNISLNGSENKYKMAPFIPSASGDFDHQQLIFYKSKKFSLEAVEAIPTAVRDINYYQLKLNTTDQETDPVLFEIFVTHLKSSTGTANKNLRLESVLEFISRLNVLESNSFVIFAGDLNLYTASEPAYQELLNPDNFITMADPIDRPGSWNNNINFQDIHSQSTRISSGPFGAGAGGGLDDRFDFIMISENMMTDPKLKYIPDTYKSFGNNGNCYDRNINDPECEGDFSQNLRDNLYYMSDHLPIVMDLETNKEIVLNTDEFTFHTSISLENTLVREILKIHLNSNIPENISFEIYNVIGQKLLEYYSRDQQSITLDISHFADGLYYLKTNLPNSQTFKFLKSS